MRLALAQFDFPVGDVAGNATRIARLIAQARDEHHARAEFVTRLRRQRDDAIGIGVDRPDGEVELGECEA